MHYDVVVAGGGMVGAVLACALKQQGIGVLVIEPRPPQLNPTLGDYALRVSALTLASQRILHKLGAWAGITDMRVQPFQDMHVWDAQGDGSVHFDCRRIAQSALGYLVENPVIQTNLWRRMQSLDVAVTQTELVKRTYDPLQQCNHLQLQNGQCVTAQLLVAADGARSKTRELIGVEIDQHDYQHTALVATVRPELPHQATAWQRFLPSGPLAFLPLPENFCSIVWSTSPEQAEQLLHCEIAAFEQRLTDAFEHRLGAVTLCSERCAYPLVKRHAQTYVKPGAALIGDAAHTIHPLAGQGVNLGFLDAASLAQVLAQAARTGDNLGRHALLRKYARWRKGHNLLLMSVMSGLKNLYANQLLPVEWARNTGMRLFDNAMPIKREVILHAVGLKGDLPDLAKTP